MLGVEEHINPPVHEVLGAAREIMTVSGLYNHINYCVRCRRGRGIAKRD
jgi:hypothetical protein